MKKKQVYLFIFIFTAIILAGIFVLYSSLKKEEVMSENDIVALYIPFDAGHIMIDETTDTVFSISFPQEIYDTNGKKISYKDLKAGNRIRISGNGIMLESYPGQYPGVTRLTVVDEGAPEDIEKYRDVIDIVHPKSQITDLPSMNIEYVIPEAVVTVMADPISYEWNSDDISLSQKGSHVLNVNYALPHIKLSDPTDLSLLFSSTPDTVSITRYDASEKSVSSGTSVSYSQFEDEHETLFTIPKVFGNFIYEVKAEWPEGHVTFGFHINDK